jgi:TRAP-type C4-dicarboxylate transport system permease large subunit
VGAFIEHLTIPSLGVVVVILVIYLVLGAVLDEIAAVLITLPFILPVIVKLGYDPVWWGIVSVVVIEIGMIIPPMGVIVFVLHGVARDIPIRTIYRGVLPFVVADVVLLALLVTIPGISMWLPKLIGG